MACGGRARRASPAGDGGARRHAAPPAASAAAVRRNRRHDPRRGGGMVVDRPRLEGGGPRLPGCIFAPMRLLIFTLLWISTSAMAACPALLDRKMQTLDERDQSLCEYTGKVVLVVNTASECGYTPQYEGLEALYKKYRAKGLVVLGFPMNDFGGQEPGSNHEIAEFCTNLYAIDFPMFAKSELRANPFYQQLIRTTGQAPRWNFHKYLLDRNGSRVQSFGSAVEPGDPKLVGAIERLLQETR